MKNLLSGLLLFTTLNYASALPNFDPFADATANGGTSYAVDTGLAPNTSNDGGTNTWRLVGSNNPGNPQPTIVAGNLSYLDLPASTGNSVSNAPSPGPTAGQTARLDLNLTAAPSIAYYSFILKITDLTAVPATNNNNFFAGFSDGTVAQGGTLARCGGRLVAKTSGAGYVLGIGRGSTVADYAYDPTERNTNDVLFVVVSYERSGGSSNINLWVNPPSPSFGSNAPPAAIASITSGSSAGDLNSSGVDGFVISCQTVLSPSSIIDDVRVATNWGVVTGGNPVFPLAITSQPASRTVKVGDRVAFVVGVAGTSPEYQWRFNGTNISDATNASYSLASAQTTNAGSYSVVVTNMLNLNSVTSAPAVLTVSETALQLYETNLVVVRVGDGEQVLTTSGNSVFLDQFTTAGNYVNTIFIPDTGASALIESGPDLTGSTLTGTALTRSADKRFLALSGYNTGLTNATALQNTLSADVPRGVVTIDSSSQVTLALADTSAYDAGHFRGATTDGTNNFWGSGSINGTYYFGLNSPAALVQTVFANTRSVDIFNGDLYCLGSATSANGLIKFTGLPTTDQGAVANMLPGFNSVNTTDFSVDPTGTLIYLTVSSSIQKWQFDGSTWTNNAYALTLASTARYLTVDYSGASPVIYVDTADGLLMKIVDTGAGSPATTLATSGPNQLFKGIRFGPIETVAQPTLSFSREGTNLILSWTGAFPLLSATNVAGPYEPVLDATSPYTNTISSPVERYFGLGNP